MHNCEASTFNLSSDGGSGLAWPWLWGPFLMIVPFCCTQCFSESESIAPQPRPQALPGDGEGDGETPATAGSESDLIVTGLVVNPLASTQVPERTPHTVGYCSMAYLTRRDVCILTRLPLRYTLCVYMTGPTGRGVCV